MAIFDLAADQQMSWLNSLLQQRGANQDYVNMTQKHKPDKSG